MAGVCVGETGFRRGSAHCLRFEKSAGCEDAERPEVNSQAASGNEGVTKGRKIWNLKVPKFILGRTRF